MCTESGNEEMFLHEIEDLIPNDVIIVEKETLDQTMFGKLRLSKT